MLRLAVTTEAGWAERALERLDEILLDHAHAEKKAAGAAVALIFRYPEHADLLAPLSRLAREELGHFEGVLAQLAARGIPFARQKASPYAGRLRRVVRSTEPGRLVDTLLCAALVEARSCERFGLLAEALDGKEPELAAFYRGLQAAEARHHRVYVELAERIAPAEAVRARLGQVAAHEARILERGARAGRLHD